MILSVSRRTDIPAFYSDWFYNRVAEGYALVRNPLNPKQISKVLINPEVVDCIVFWTKNPAPMLARLYEIKNYNYYFQITLNSYSQTLECRVPNKKQIVGTVQRLSDKIGSQRVVWRYDPIFLTSEINIDYHIKYFEWIAKHLAGYTNTCKISLLTNYKKTQRNMKHISLKELDAEDAPLLAKSLAEIAKSYNIEVQACTTIFDLSVTPGQCIDKARIENIADCLIDAKKDKNQRAECNCIESIDIGEYHTCLHNCLYCYANDNDQKAQQKYKQHHSISPILVGNITKEEQTGIKNRRCVSFRQVRKQPQVATYALDY